MNDKGFKVGVLVALIAMIVVVGVGFAAFTTTLNINGTAKVEASSWNIHFANCTGGNCLKTSNTQAISGIKSTTVVNTEPTLTDTTINNWDVTFKTPGDSVTYAFNVVNDGSFNAKISTFELPTPTCTGTGDNADADATNVCKHLEYKLEVLELGNMIPSNVAVGNTLNKAETKPFMLTLTYKDDITDAELPKGDVTISNLGFSIVYTQA